MRGLLLLLFCVPAGAQDYGRVREAPHDLLLSLREEARPEGLATLFASGAGAVVSHQHDDGVKDDVLHASAVGKSGRDAGTALGNAAILFPAVGAVYLAGARFGGEGAQEFGLMGLEALTLGGAQGVLLKYTVRRRRPDGADHYSFPSGHANAAFSLAAVAGSQFGWKVGVPAYLTAGYVAYTRIESNKHYLSDVVFGAGLGIAAGRAVWKTRSHAHPDRFALVPLADPPGLALVVPF